LAVALHRNGHTQGDDFALYLRQARAVFDGDIAQVVADNRFTVNNSASRFSPIAYPWGLPLLLSPFVKAVGLDYDVLKYVIVAAFATWLVLVHGIVRRRVGDVIALAVVAVVGTAPALLAHTDQLLSEFPHAVAVAVVIWWLDRIRRDGTLVAAPIAQQVVLGALVAVAFNVRRESIMIIAAIVLVQIAELAGTARRGGRVDVDQDVVTRLVAPHATFVVAVAVGQFLLPSMLFPDNGGGSQFVPDRIGDYTGWLSRHLGLGWHPAVGAAVLVVALAGLVLAVWRRPGLDGPLAAIALVSLFAVSTHFRMVDRYYFQVLPWIVYFFAVALSEFAHGVGALASRSRRTASAGRAPRIGASAPSRHRRVVTGAALAPLAFVVAVHAAVLPGDIRDAVRFDRAGRQQFGPTHPDVVPIYAAVSRLTAAGDVVAFFRARTMTLLTDRSAIQTSNVDRIILHADWFAQRRNSDYVQPDLTPAQARALGFEEVWSDRLWILWRVPADPPPALPSEPDGTGTVGIGDGGLPVFGSAGDRSPSTAGG
jgi:hypothetical protein